MRFTEGYWQQREDLTLLHAVQSYDIAEIDGGVRVFATCRPVSGRGGVISCPMLTVDFKIVADGVFSVEAVHHAALRDTAPAFDRRFEPVPVQVTIGENEATVVSGEYVIRVGREAWGYSFERAGKVLTSSGFRNLGCALRSGRARSFAYGEDYLRQPDKTYMKDELNLAPGELVYGLGERFTPFVKNGQRVETWNEDGGTSSDVSYKCVPFYMTNRGYGVLVDHTGNVSFEIATEKVSRAGFSVEGERLRYYVFCGEPKEILRRYCAAFGLPALPPAWSFGLWLSTSFTTDYDEKTVAAMISGMRERGIPTRVFHFDCFWMKEFNLCDLTWDERVFPDPEGMLRRYKEQGLNICVWINPYISQRGAIFEEAASKGYLLRRADGRGARQLDMWMPGMGLVDFTNPEACAWFQGKLKKLLDMGVDCFKTDFGERIPVDVAYHDGSDPTAMHNYYTYLYNKCVFELLERERGAGNALVFARSATAGGQKFPVHWGGDCSASYESMAETLRGGLSFAQSGFSFWSHDISGFEHTAAPDIYKRWCAFGLLSSHSRLHGSVSYRVPWLFDEEACGVLRHFVNLKCRLMPYIYGQAARAHETGEPLMRPMMMEFPGDRTAQNLDMQYMLGESLLVAPVFSEDGTVSYYLPDGTWTHYLTGEEKQGGRWYEERFDYFSLPLFVRKNTLLAVGGRDDLPDYDYASGAELRLYSLESGARAECRIPDLTGKTALTASAVRAGNKIAFELDGAPDGVTVVLCNARAAASVEGASAEACEGGVRLRPQASRFVVEL